jgi:hypothetical protein
VFRNSEQKSGSEILIPTHPKNIRPKKLKKLEKFGVFCKSVQNDDLEQTILYVFFSNGQPLGPPPASPPTNHAQLSFPSMPRYETPPISVSLSTQACILPP